MNSRSVITLFQQMSEHLESLVSMFGSIRSYVGRAQETEPLLEGSQTSTLYATSMLHTIEQATQKFEATNADLNHALHKLRQRIDQLYLLHEITSQLNEQVSLDHVIDRMDEGIEFRRHAGGAQRLEMARIDRLHFAAEPVQIDERAPHHEPDGDPYQRQQHENRP